ncbi:MAG TPA: YncE family protein [Bryobacteraceae bacterium]|jgi:YVTN family beta-propeller protein|nr:YncE family protein [Bryobacteraceae bacterium]
MRKKIKLYGLISLFLLLASCDQSCDYEYFGYLNSGRSVFVVGSTGMWTLSGVSAINIDDVNGFSLNWVGSKYKYFGGSFPLVPHGVPNLREVITSNKPALWAVSSADNAVYLVDSTGPNFIYGAKIPVGRAPTSAVFSADNNLLYVTNSGADSISVIDTNSTNVGLIALNPGSRPTAIATTPDGTSLFVINSGLSSVSQVDTASKKVVGTFSVGQGPLALAVTPDGLLVYVCNSKDNTVTVHDVLSLEKVQTVTGITNPTSIAFSVDGITAYVTSGISPAGLLYTIRAKSYRLGKTPITVGNNPVYVALDTYNTLIYVANKGSNNLTIINSNDNSIAGTIALGGSPTGVISLP